MLTLLLHALNYPINTGHYSSSYESSSDEEGLRSGNEDEDFNDVKQVVLPLEW